jgi:hypothetical protein
MRERVAMFFAIPRLLVALGIMAAAALPLAAQDWTGYWEGAIQIAPAELEVDVLLEMSRTGGGLDGRLWFPTHPSGPYAVDVRAVDRRSISFQVTDSDHVVSAFDGTLDAQESVLAGTFHEQQATYRFELRRRLQPPPVTLQVADLGDDAAGLRSAFDRDAGHVRLLLVLSPQSFASKITLRMLQRSVLEPITDPALRVYAVWEPTPAAIARGFGASAVKPLICDPRVAEFYLRHQIVSRLLAPTAAAGSAEDHSLCLLFRGDRRWVGAAPPQAERLWLAPLHDLTVAIAPQQRFNGPNVAAAVRALLAAARVTSGGEGW